MQVPRRTANWFVSVITVGVAGPDVARSSWLTEDTQQLFGHP